MKVQLSKHWNKGLGTQLCVLSTLLHLKVTHIETDNFLVYKVFREFVDIFNLTNLKIDIVDNGIKNPIDPNDFFKMFSPYYKKSRANKNKKFIGLSCYTDSTNLFDWYFTINNGENKHYPNYKTYPIEDYSEIFTIIKKAGYDVLTLDSKHISLTDKIFIIENFCECVIGYEGGIAHLCHMLNVPFIMIPWRIKKFDGYEELLHLDNKTYFLNTIYELLNWKNYEKDKLNEVIDLLNLEQGNNRFLNKQEQIHISNELTFLSNQNAQIEIPFSEYEKPFLLEHFPNRVLGGQ